MILSGIFNPLTQENNLNIMDKRKFIKILGIGGAAMAVSPVLFSPGCKTSSAKQPVKNWMWIHSPNDSSPDELKARLENARNHGIDAVLMETSISEISATESEWQPLNHPTLERLVEAGRATGVEVHCWLWQMPNNIPAIAEKHGSWFAVNGRGEPAHTHPAYVGYYKFMCPNNPEVREYLRLRVKSAGSLEGLAGVHLDYIRLPDVILAEALQPNYNIVQDREYPEYDYCYCERCRNMFKEQTGIDPLKDLEDPSASLEWRQFRYDSVTGLVNGVLVPEVRKTDKMVTAAVFPNWESVRQEWRNWELDAYFPMLYHNFYNAGIDWIGEHVRMHIDQLRIKKPVYSGLFLPSLKPEELREAYIVSREAGAAGVSLFGNISDEHFRVLKELRSL
jgi:uncharacterized lipoprotein YddW (UPF0748 family)